MLADHRIDPSMGDNICFIKACRGGVLDVVNLLMARPEVNVAARSHMGVASFFTCLIIFSSFRSRLPQGPY